MSAERVHDPNELRSLCCQGTDQQSHQHPLLLACEATGKSRLGIASDSFGCSNAVFLILPLRIVEVCWDCNHSTSHTLPYESLRTVMRSKEKADTNKNVFMQCTELATSGPQREFGQKYLRTDLQPSSTYLCSSWQLGVVFSVASAVCFIFVRILRSVCNSFGQLCPASYESNHVKHQQFLWFCTGLCQEAWRKFPQDETFYRRPGTPPASPDWRALV